MAEIIRMPRLSDTMEEGNIVEWLKDEGDKVEPGDILAEVETDKATMELESFHSGTLLHIGVKEGAVPVDAVIAVIGEEGEDYEKILEEAEDKTEKDEEKSEDDAKESKEQAEDSKEKDKGKDKDEKKGDSAEPAKEAPSKEDDSRIKASPLARKMAEEKGVDLSRIQGSGDNGRIIKRDIEEAEKSQSAAAPLSEPSPLRPEVNYGKQPVSQMRKTIARRLSESKFSAPHFYLTMDINMDNAAQARSEMNEFSPVKISFNDLVVKAAAFALQMHPQVNASWTGDAIDFHKEINVGVAVAIDEGLMVPVVNNANLKSLSQIKNEVKELAEKARDRKLSTEEMQGNTFTVSNLGMFGIEEFTAIINPPDSCILAVGAIIEKPVVKDGEITKAKMMKVTLSCDHRIVDGATGARFLQTLQQLLESPYNLLV
ncbi:MAG: pyruvate dehydrogenase complex dihydrolipoamide acetyltransferase [Saprospiraceae bacterium]|nr:pyruvate dehydrogenase complex dihydrolipoamide acetyltransferase [Saprospiraceae bacterium]